MEVEYLNDTLDYLACWLFSNIVSMFTMLPVCDSVYRRATLPKTIRPRTETTMETANKFNLVWHQMAMMARHVNDEVVGSIHTLWIVVESSFLLLPSG